MVRAVLVAVVLTMGTTGCARIQSSNLNPFNWFDRTPVLAEVEPVPAPVVAADVPVTTAPAPELITTAQVDPRPLIDQVAAIRLEPTAGGAILRAVGVPPTTGYWDAGLTRLDGVEPGVLAFTFRAVPPPPGGARAAAQDAREVEVATFISRQRLAVTREIRVVGAQNGQSLRP